VQRRFHTVLERKIAERWGFASGTKKLIRLPAFIKEKASRDDQSLKVR
jgi:hypothetical protein